MLQALVTALHGTTVLDVTNLLYGNTMLYGHTELYGTILLYGTTVLYGITLVHYGVVSLYGTKFTVRHYSALLLYRRASEAAQIQWNGGEASSGCIA